MPAPTQPDSTGAQERGPAPTLTAGLFYILHGDDELGIAEALARLRRRAGRGDPAMAELNTNVFDGHEVSFQELRHVCDAIPFLEDRRLVIVHGLLGRLASERASRDEETSDAEEPAWRRTYVKSLIEYLPRLPATTRLVFVEGRALEPSHPVLRFAAAHGTNRGAFVELLRGPKEHELAGWIVARVRSKKGTIAPDAAAMLAGLIGRDLRLLDLEVDKLLVHGEGRQVTAEDVKALVSQAREIDIFDLVDSIGRRQTDRALGLLHGLLSDGKEPLYLLGMLARQLRVLMEVGELREQGLSADEIARRAALHPFVVEKALAQVRNFSMAQLEAAHRQAVKTDWAIKTGQIEDVLALDLLVVGLGHKQAH